MTTNKLHASEENPLDNLVYGVTTPLLPAFRATGHTPNAITTYSFACGLLAAFALWHGYLFAFASLYTLSYVFDCMDGQMARTYQMSSRFGDLYDHVTDLAVYLLLLYVVVVRHKRPPTPPVVVTMVLATVLLMVSVGCQQHRKPSDIGDESIDLTKHACREREWIHWTRFFSPATFLLVTIICIVHMFREPRPTACLQPSPGHRFASNSACF
jgi:phosphatidylglycerophosphate synthase